MTQKYATTGITEECPTPASGRSGSRALGYRRPRLRMMARTARQTLKRQRVAPKGSAVATPNAVVGVAT
jgi:hypothetical protein